MAKSDAFWADIVPQVDPEKCRRCADCPPVVTCLAQGFLRDEPDGVPVVDASLCFGCYSCVQACPHGAISLPRDR